MAGSILTLLFIDDDTVEQNVFAERAAAAPWHDRISIVSATDATEALEILRGTHPDKQIDRPLVIILDLHLPGMDGCECLKEIKGDSKLREFPVIMLSTSSEKADIERAYTYGACAYVEKEKAGKHYEQLIQLASDLAGLSTFVAK